MKKTILTLMSAAMFGVSNGNIVADIEIEAGTKVSTSSTNKGLKLRGDSTAYSVGLNSDIAQGQVGVGVNFYDVHGGGSDLDLLFSYSREVSILGQDFVADFYYNQFDSSWGDWEEIGVGTLYETPWVDLGGQLWKQVGGEGQFGATLSVSKTLGAGLINEFLDFTPYLDLNLAEEFSAYEAGIKAYYDLGNGVSLGAKVAIKDCSAEGSAGIDNTVGYTLGMKIKF